jgi:hypothetical protein
VTRARILLKAVAGCRDEEIVENPLGPETRAAEHA